MHSKGINQENIQYLNRELVLRVLRKNEGCSRAELAKITHLKPATITNIINELQELNLVRESGTISEGKGRSAIRLVLNPNAYNVVGIRIARRYLIVGVFDVRGDELKSVRCEIESWMNINDVLNRVMKYAHQAINEWAQGEVVAIGCAIPGPFLKGEGKVVLVTGMPVWKDCDIKEELKKEFNLPVFMEHDANAGALAYYWKSGENLRQTLVYMAVGQGVGAGIVQDGSLMSGQLGIAGEIGHMSINFEGPYCECGSRGCLEMYCSSIALKKEIAHGILQGNYTCLTEECTLDEIAEAVAKGDRFAVECYRRICKRLAIGVVNVINMLNPDKIVIDDDFISVAPDMVREVLNKEIRPAILPQIWDNLEMVIGEGTQAFVLKGVAISAAEGILRERFASK